MTHSPVERAFRERLGRLPALDRFADGPIAVDRLHPRPGDPGPIQNFAMDGVTFERWRIPGPYGEIPAWFLCPAPSLSGGPGALPENDLRKNGLPVVVALHPHGRQFELGKSLVAGLVGDGTRAYGLAAARAGFAVLAPDMLGFEDHRPSLAARKGNYALQGEAYERLLFAEALVQGETLQGRMLTELSVCADALGREARVDPGRIAIMGQSYGGQEALLGMLFDSRFRAGIVSCGFSLLRLLVERRISHNLALYVPGLLPDLDLDALVPAIAPRPLTVIAGRRDAIFPVEGVEQVEAKARQAWLDGGAADLLRFRYFDGPHDFPQSELEESLAWLATVY